MLGMRTPGGCFAPRGQLRPGRGFTRPTLKSNGRFLGSQPTQKASDDRMF
jgi:hypothetical protein